MSSTPSDIEIYVPEADVPKIKDDAVYAEGDFTIISSDRVRFRLPSYYIFASSEVLRDMFKLGSTGPLELELLDNELEEAVSVRLWLDLIVDPPPGAQIRVPASQDCYRCADLSCAGPGEAKPEPILLAAAQFGETDLVEKCLRDKARWTWGHTAIDLIDAISKGQITDVQSWSWELWRELPSTYAFAMMRARTTSSTDTERAIKFVEIMKLINGSEAERRAKSG